MLGAIERRLQRTALGAADAVEQHHELMLGAGPVRVVGGEEDAQRRRPERPPHQVDKRDHGWPPEALLRAMSRRGISAVSSGGSARTISRTEPNSALERARRAIVGTPRPVSASGVSPS